MYKIMVDHNPNQSDNEVVKEGLIKSYEAPFDVRDKKNLYLLKNGSGKVFGCIQAMFDSEAIYIEALRIEENLRKQGQGYIFYMPHQNNPCETTPVQFLQSLPMSQK